MKIIVWLIAFAFACIITTSFYFCYIKGYNQEHSLKPGQIWIWKSEDPFNKKQFKFKILNVKDHYVQFISNDIDTGSWTVNFFFMNNVSLQK